MITHDQLVAEWNALLAPRYRLSAGLSSGPATMKIPAGVLTGPLVAIPDVHLGDAGDGDIFYDGDADNVARLEAVLQATYTTLGRHPDATAVQLGDWFDVWRASGGDVKSTDYGGIQNASAYANILDLDAKIGLKHLVGNHDASFLNAIPDRRAQQASSFRLGAFLGSSVYAMHGHQTDLTPPQNSWSDELFVAIATAAASFVPKVTTFEAFVDRGYGAGSVIGGWLLSALGLLRDDPGPSSRPRDTRAGAPDPDANFVVRENVDVLASIVTKVAAQKNVAAPKLLVVGHSHAPCVAWTETSAGPLLVADAGGWVYGQANVLLAAGDRLTVFDVTRA